jgi:hypothetical protein
MDPENEFEDITRAVEVFAQDERHGMKLDFTQESIEQIDDFIRGLRGNGDTPESIPTLIFLLGAYVGEVLIRHHDGKWVQGEAESVPMVEMPSGAKINLVGKAIRFLRADEGDELSVLYKYAVTLGSA